MRIIETLTCDLQNYRRLAGDRNLPVSIWMLFRAALSPRFMPVILLRLACWTDSLGVPLVPKAFSMLNFWIFGIEVAVKCEIGPGLCLPHTMGTVIGARKIGRNAVIYHQVTIGAKAMDVAYTPSARPTIGDDVILGSGAKILGGITVGNRVVVGANAVVVSCIADGCLAVGVPARAARIDCSSKAEDEM